MREKIRPCPFCGERSALEVGPDALAYLNIESVCVQCLECGAEGPTGGTIDEAIGGWNNRRAAHYSDDDKGRAQRMNDAGVCNAEIARRLGCTASTVDGWVKSSHPTGRRFTEEEKVKAIYRVEDGEDVATVAAEIGAAYSTVYRWLKKEKRAI